VLPLHHGHHQYRGRTARPRAEGAGVEPARLSLARFPSGSRLQSGSPSIIRSRCSGRRGIRTLMPVGAHSLAVRPGEPYPATFRRSTENRVDRRGVEPRSPGCKPGIFPLDERPLIDQFINKYESSPRESNPHLPGVGRAPSPLDQGTLRPHTSSQDHTVAEVGVEPTSTSLSSWRLCQFAYPAVEQNRQSSCGHGSRAHPPSLGNSAERRPARKVPGPGLEPGSRPYEGQSSTCPPGSG
jgi:hypothetical protein